MLSRKNKNEVLVYGFENGLFPDCLIIKDGMQKQQTKSEETGRMNHSHLESKLNSPRARVVCSLSKRGVPHGCSLALDPLSLVPLSDASPRNYF